MIKSFWSKIKNIVGLKNVTFLSTSSLVGNAIAMLFWLYVADVLGVEEYGKLGYLIGIASIAASMTLFGGENAIIVYTAKGVKIQPPVYLISLFSSAVAAVVLFVMFSDFGVSIFVFGYVIFSLITNELLGKKLYKNWSYHFVIQKILMITLSLAFYYIIGPPGVILGIGLSFLPFSRRLYFVFKEKTIDFEVLKGKLGFILNQYVINFLSIFKTQIDKLLIVAMFGYVLLGNYFLAIQIIGFLIIIPGAIFRYLLPEASSGSETRSMKILVCITAVIFTLVGIFVAPSGIELFFPQFSDSVHLIPILSLAVIPAAVKDIFTAQILAKEKSKFLIFANILALAVFLLGIFTLGEFFGIIGVAIAFIISYSVYTLFLIIVSYKFIK